MGQIQGPLLFQPCKDDYGWKMFDLVFDEEILLDEFVTIFVSVLEWTFSLNMFSVSLMPWSSSCSNIKHGFIATEFGWTRIVGSVIAIVA